MRSKTTKLRHERSNPNPVGLWTFQNVDTKHTIMCGILSWFWIYICEKLMRSKTTKLRHERSNPNPNSRVMDFSECRHKTYHHVQNFELILNILVKNWCGRRRPSYDMNDPTLTLTVGLWTFQNVDTKHTIMCGILSWFWIYFWKIDAVEDDQVTTWTIQP